MMSGVGGHDDSEVGVVEGEGKEGFVEKVRAANAACQGGQFQAAVELYTEAIHIEPANHILYSNRSAAYVKLGKFQKALQDAIHARELNAKWPKAYYRQGVALQCLGRHPDALAAFASGLAQDAKSLHLLAGLVEAALKSPLRASVEPIYCQLQAMKLDKSPFVVISVIGQELLAAGHYSAAVVVLEAGLRIGTCSLKLRGSVFSALSSCYWALGSVDKALNYMQQDLAVAKTLGDIAGECRAHGNLGSAHFSKGCFREALTSHRYQLVLAMKCKDSQGAASALTSLGHVYTAVGDHANALASHKQCVQLVKQMGERLLEAREIGNVGAVYLSMGDVDNAIQCHLEHLRIAKELANRVEEARAYSNLGSAYHYRRNFEQAMSYHQEVLSLAQDLKDKTIEARAYAGLGHASRCLGDFSQAKRWHERQLEMALALRDKVGEGRACSNLGIVYQLMGDQDAALKLHQAHLNIARLVQDKAGMGRAYGNIGNVYSALGCYQQAIQYHKQELAISKDVCDRSSEAATHGNLAVAYQALGLHDMALIHYKSHLAIARDLKDQAGEACSLLNLGNCLSARGGFSEAIPYYEQYLMISQEQQDVEGESKACHLLGYAHYCLGNHREAIRYYEQDLSLSKDLQDQTNMARGYCNLGLAYVALGEYQKAMDCQKYFLAIAHLMKHTAGKFRALGNIGDILQKQEQSEEAMKCYQKQLELARQSGERTLEAQAYGSLGQAHKANGMLDKSLSYHTQELTLYQELGDAKGECRALGHLGAVHTALGNHSHALKCYMEQLERARDIGNQQLEAQALGNLGVARMNLGQVEEASKDLEKQLELLRRHKCGPLERGRVLGHLGDCYASLGKTEDALAAHEEYLSLSQGSAKDQDRAYQGLGSAHQLQGNLQQALLSLEKRLVVCHPMPRAQAIAYGDLGEVHIRLGNYEQAVACLQRKLNLAKSTEDSSLEADAASSLGTAFRGMGDYVRAFEYYEVDLNISGGQKGRGLSNIAALKEEQGRSEEAEGFYKQLLRFAEEQKSRALKTKALTALGRLHLRRGPGEETEALSCFTLGLASASSLTDRIQLHAAIGECHFQRPGEEAEAELHLSDACRLGGLPSESLVFLLLNKEKYEEALFLIERRRQILKANDSKHMSATNLGTLTRSSSLMMSTLEKLKEPLIYYHVYNPSLHPVASLLDDTVKGSSENLYDQAGGVGSVLEKSTNSSCEEGGGIDAYYPATSDKKRCKLWKWLVMPFKEEIQFHEAELEEGDFPFEADLAEVRSALGVGEERAPSSVDEGDDSAAPVFRRANPLTSSNHSLSSLFSLGSLTSSRSRRSTRSNASSAWSHWEGPPSLARLYNLLIEPFDLPCCPRLLLVLDTPLRGVPFPLLRGPDGFLSQNYSILISPGIGVSHRTKVVGSVSGPIVIDGKEHGSEAHLVSEILATNSLIGDKATRNGILDSLTRSDVAHLALPLTSQGMLVTHPGESCGQPDVLTPGDFGTVRPSFLMLNWYSPPSDEKHQLITPDQVMALAFTFVVSLGVKCVAVPLWPVTETARKIFLRSFYTSLVQGASVSCALNEAQLTVSHTKHLSHPIHWGGYVVVGCSDVRLPTEWRSLGASLTALLATPSHSRDALRVCLHLVEKSLQRLSRPNAKAMYTTLASIEKKVGVVAEGWRDLLMSVGFRFEPPGGSLPASVFFPQSNPGNRLGTASEALQSLCGLSPPVHAALGRIAAVGIQGEEVKALLHQLVLHETEDSWEVPVSLWSVSGCHELLSSIGCDLQDVGRDKVRLGINALDGRQLQFALSSLGVLLDFDDDDERDDQAMVDEEDEDGGGFYSSASGGAGSGGTPSVVGSASTRAFSKVGVVKKQRGEPDGGSGVKPEPDLSSRGRPQPSSQNAPLFLGFNPSPTSPFKPPRGSPGISGPGAMSSPLKPAGAVRHLGGVSSRTVATASKELFATTGASGTTSMLATASSLRDQLLVRQVNRVSSPPPPPPVKGMFPTASSSNQGSRPSQPHPHHQHFHPLSPAPSLSALLQEEERQTRETGDGCYGMVAGATGVSYATRVPTNRGNVRTTGGVFAPEYDDECAIGIDTFAQLNPDQSEEIQKYLQHVFVAPPPPHRPPHYPPPSSRHDAKFL